METTGVTLLLLGLMRRKFVTGDQFIYSATVNKLTAGLSNLAFENSAQGGTIPTELGHLTALTFLNLRANTLTGTIHSIRTSRVGSLGRCTTV